MPSLSIDIDPSGARTGARVVNRNLDGIKRRARSTERAVGQLGSNSKRSFTEAATGAKSLGTELGRVKTAALALGVVFAARVFITVAAQYQDLRTSLQAVTGSAEGAADAFTLINDVVGKTPFTVSQLTQSFVKLKAAGLEPSTEQMMLFSDVASLTADRVGTLQAITDLYARTTAGGLGLEDLNRLADRGVPVFKIFQDSLGLARLEIAEVGKTAAGSAILLETLELGLNKVAGGASELAGKNLSVAFSNLMDAIRATIDVALNLTGATAGMGGALQSVADIIQGFNGQLKDYIEATSNAWKESAVFRGAVWGLVGVFTLGIVPAIVTVVSNFETLSAWFGLKMPAMMKTATAAWFGFKASLLSIVNSIAVGMVEAMTGGFNAAFIAPLQAAQQFAKDHPIAATITGTIGLAALPDIKEIESTFKGFESVTAASTAALNSQESALVNAAHLTRQYNEILKELTITKSDDTVVTKETVEEAAALETKLESLRERLKLLGDSGEEAGSKIKSSLNRAKDASEELGQSMSDSFGQGVIDVIKGTQTIAGAFKNMASLIIEELFKIIVVEQLVASLKTIAGGLFGGGINIGGGGTGTGGLPLPFANGAAFAGGNVTPFANGGIVNSPTLFPMANGAGLMGEAGPEAVMPLTRGRDGKLGVKSSGGGSVTQNVTINAIGEGDLDRILSRRMPQLKEMVISTMRNERVRGAF